MFYITTTLYQMMHQTDCMIFIAPLLPWQRDIFLPYSHPFLLLKIMPRHIRTACNPAGTSPLKLREQLLSDKSPFNPRGGWGFVLIGALVPLNPSSLFWIWLIISTGYSFAIISRLNVIEIPLTLMLFMQARTFSYKFVSHNSIGFYSRPEINHGVLSRKSHNYYINHMMFS